MELVLSSAKELSKEISDEYFGEALYQMYCALKSLNRKVIGLLVDVTYLQ